jgi:mono/diheme cytochrome c family protein
MKRVLKISTVLCLVMVLASCHSDTKPNYQYFPNMYESVGYETYSESDAFNSPYGLKGKEGQLPAVGSIKRGYVPYELANDNDGYLASKLVLSAPLSSQEYDETKAKELFEIYCAICHGVQGNGKGKLVTQEKILGVPSYADRVISIGSVNHVINYGINSMGAYSNQLDQKERWMVSTYVMKLKGEL